MPDSTVIQLANNTDDFFLQLHSNITNICNFSNEHFSKGDSPGTYVYSADSSNIGWHVADNGNKVLYNPHDLSSSSITLSGLRTDPGACANGLREIDVALNIGNRVADYLRAVGYDVKLAQIDGLQEICDAIHNQLVNSLRFGLCCFEWHRLSCRTG